MKEISREQLSELLVKHDNDNPRYVLLEEFLNSGYEVADITEEIAQFERPQGITNEAVAQGVYQLIRKHFKGQIKFHNRKGKFYLSRVEEVKSDN